MVKWVTGVIMLMLLALALLLSALPLFGLQARVERSNSMKPNITTGDILIERQTTVATLQNGQVVTLQDADRGSVTHRLQSSYLKGENLVLTTKGDSNVSSETWSVAPGSSAGVIIARLPYLGFAVLPFKSVAGMLALLLTGGLVLVRSAVVRSRRNQRRIVIIGSPIAATLGIEGRSASSRSRGGN